MIGESGPPRLVQSDDGGKTWRDVDAPREISSALGVVIEEVDGANLAVRSPETLTPTRTIPPVRYVTSDGGKTWRVDPPARFVATHDGTEWARLDP